LVKWTGRNASSTRFSSGDFEAREWLGKVVAVEAPVAGRSLDVGFRRISDFP
jgi:hypothetical protein